MEKRNVYEIFVNQSKRGNAFASWKLAMMHMTGRGCARSTEKAMEFLETAAAQNSLLGRRDLAKATLRGMTRSMSTPRAYRELLSVLKMGITSGVSGVLMESGNPRLEKTAVKYLSRASLERAAFEARYYVAIYNLTGGGVPVSKAELYGRLREIADGADEESAKLAHRSMWLSDTLSFFFLRASLVDTVKAMLSLPDDESKIDGFELAYKMGEDCPAELKVSALKAVSLLALRGHRQAKVISLCMNLLEASESARPQLVEQLGKMVEARPEYFNEHVAYVFRRLQNEYHGFTEFILPLLRRIQRPHLHIPRIALVSALLDLGQEEEALPLIIELLNAGQCNHFQACVDIHLKLFKQGKVDAETALFWAEALQQDEAQEGLASVQAVYEAMGAQTPEQKLLRYQVLEERVKQGDPEASTDLGILLLDGKGVCISNKQRAFKLFESAAAKNNAKAMFQLGQCFFRGIGTHVDADMGHYWITRAAALGYSRTQKMISEKEEPSSENDDDENTEMAETEQQILDLIEFRKRMEAEKMEPSRAASIDKEGA